MSIKKFKTLFLITLIIDLLATIPLVLVSFNPTMMNEMVYSQFPGINEAGKEALDLFHFVFGLIAISMIVALIVALRIKIKESAQTAALILFIFHIGWIAPDWINFLMGLQHPPIPVMLLGLVSVISLGYAWKKGEI
tara:strand:+ start:516 stop:926 length:411 start_codon:yes stop_codon:yes gene_type:complete